jgi:hypothetical protein
VSLDFPVILVFLAFLGNYLKNLECLELLDHLEDLEVLAFLENYLKLLGFLENYLKVLGFLELLDRLVPEDPANLEHPANPENLQSLVLKDLMHKEGHSKVFLHHQI